MNKLDMIERFPDRFAVQEVGANYLERIADDVEFNGVPKSDGRVACIGEGSTIYTGVTLSSRVELGTNVTIGRHTLLGAHVVITDHIIR